MIHFVKNVQIWMFFRSVRIKSEYGKIRAMENSVFGNFLRSNSLSLPNNRHCWIILLLLLQQSKKYIIPPTSTTSLRCNFYYCYKMIQNNEFCKALLFFFLSCWISMMTDAPKSPLLSTSNFAGTFNKNTFTKHSTYRNFITY